MSIAEDLEISRLEDLVNQFAYEMKIKLTRCVIERGKSGWDDPKWSEKQIEKVLRMEIAQEKVDPVDIANYCAFLWYRKRPKKSIIVHDMKNYSNGASFKNE